MALKNKKENKIHLHKSNGGRDDRVCVCLCFKEKYSLKNLLLDVMKINYYNRNRTNKNARF